MWAKVGLKVNLLAQSMPIFIAKIQNFDASAYMLGWGVANFDANYSLVSLVHSKTTGAAGSFNLGRISDPKLDKLIEAIDVETDAKKRDAMLREALVTTRDQYYYVPLHHQMRPWAMKKNVTHGLQVGRPAGGALRDGEVGSLGLRLGGDLEEDFVVLHHPELVARALLDRVVALLQVLDFGGERAVAQLQALVPGVLRVHLAVRVPHAHPAALAQPERILDGEDEGAQDAGEDFHLSWRNASRPG